MNFQDKLNQTINKNNSLVCVGLDSDFDKLPNSILEEENPQFAFNKAIIDATADLVSSYKINSAFYEALGDVGIKTLHQTSHYIKKIYPKIPVILDAKRGDIGNTNNGYIKFAYDYLDVDAITLHPYLGSEALKPFLDLKEKGAIIMCRNSNPGAGELQDLKIGNETLYQVIAKKVTTDWNNNGNCLLVLGATFPEELAQIRKIVGDMTFLVPGIGAQGGDIEKTVKAGLNSKNAGLIIHSARGIIFASSDIDFDEKAREETQKLREEINKYRNNE